MKKLAPALVALLGLLLAGFFFLRREQPHRARAADIAPADAILFAHLPDVPRSLQRWRATALVQLWREPEVQTFLAQPMARMPLLLETQEHLRRLERIGVRELFVAMTPTPGAVPGVVAGMSFTGSKSDVAALMAEAWTGWRKSHPSATTELLQREHWEIEVSTQRDRMLAGCFLAGWYFLSTDLAALELTLARARESRADGIGSRLDVQRSFAPLPDDADAVLFAEPARVLARWEEGAEANAEESSDPTASTLGWTVKVDGAQIRDTIFVQGPRSSTRPLSGRTHRLRAGDTLFYSGFLMPEKVSVPPPLAPLLATLTAGPGLALASRSFTAQDFASAFGPEGAVALDWPAEADGPALSFAFAVRRPDRVATVMETITGSAEEDAAWEQSEIAGVTLHRARPDPRTGASPAIALLPEFVVIGAQPAAVGSAAARLTLAANTASPVEAGQDTPELDQNGAEAVAILDLPRLIERSYDTFRPFLRMSLAFSPDIGPFVDTEKLPSTAVLTKHLEPTVYRQSARPDGVLIECTGSVSLSEALAGAALTLGTSALRTLKPLPEPAVPRPAIRPRPETGASEAAESSRKMQNVDEKSPFPPSQR